MRQIHITIDIKNMGVLADLEAKVLSNLTGTSVVSALDSDERRAALSFAYNEIDEIKAAKTIKNYLIESIIEMSKKNYFVDKLSTFIPDSEKLNDVCQLLADFDYFTDYNILSEQMSVSEVFAIDGYCNFCMNNHKERWDALSKLAINNL
ncbi:MAG: hypothetical protein FWC80_05100 [Firmicutes bacterium]|nr:hypothetical protein [Bacillota bacterium]